MPDLVSLCVLRLVIYNKQKEKVVMSSTSADDAETTGDQRMPHTINVETFPNRLHSTPNDWNLLPVKNDSKKLSLDSIEDIENDDDGDEEIGFFSGNPFVEVTKGTLHLYKEDLLRNGNDALCLCLLGIPATMTCHDLLSFTAPCHADIKHIRVLRDPKPNQYMALLTFRTHVAAVEFRNTFDGSPYTGLEPERLCRAVWVSRVEWIDVDVPRAPPPGHTELPTCPVCLERMDESIDGVLTILCNHAFHADCLLKWGDSTCPVCRCVQSPELANEGGSECTGCANDSVASSGTTPPDSLWICLICGHIGCGRYQGGHAARHYTETEHCYALQLGSHRVWDYKGDNFVHRLLQNKADGKLVPVENNEQQRRRRRKQEQPELQPELQSVQEPQEIEFEDSNASAYVPVDIDTDDKIDSVQLEYTYLLTSQLDSQRRYFEDRLSRLETKAATEVEQLQTRLAEILDENVHLHATVQTLNKEKVGADRRGAQLAQKLNLLQLELNDERQLGKALRVNQQQWQTRISQMESKFNALKSSSDEQVTQLKEQVRDLMFYLEAQQVIANAENKEDIAGGTVVVGPSTSTATKTKGKGRKKR